MESQVNSIYNRLFRLKDTYLDEHTDLIETLCGYLKNQLEKNGGKRDWKHLSRCLKCLPLLLTDNKCRKVFASKGLQDILAAYEVLDPMYDDLLIDILLHFISSQNWTILNLNSIPKILEKIHSEYNASSFKKLEPLHIQNEVYKKFDVSIPSPNMECNLAGQFNAAACSVSKKNYKSYKRKWPPQSQRMRFLCPKLSQGKQTLTMDMLTEKELLPSLCAILNSQSGGRILIGVDETTRVARGIQCNSEQKDAFRIGFDRMIQKLIPWPSPDFFHVQFFSIGEDLNLIEILVEQQHTELYYFNTSAISSHKNGMGQNYCCLIREGTIERDLLFLRYTIGKLHHVKQPTLFGLVFANLLIGSSTTPIRDDIEGIKRL